MEKGLKKTLIVSGVLGGLTVFGYLFYRQILKAIEFAIEPKSVKSLGSSGRTMKLLVTMGVKNPSDLKFILKNQEYDIYLNGIFIARLENANSQIVYPQSVSTLQLTVDINIDDLLTKLDVVSGTTIADKLNVVANLRQQRLKLVSKLDIKYGILPAIPIEIPYEDTLKNWGL
jgi:hypothetical protein